MSEFFDVYGAGDLPDGTMKKIFLDGREVLLARAGDRYFAADNHCPHMGGDLSSGTLHATIVTCPLHHSQFDLADGHVVRWTDWTGIKLSSAKLLKAPRPLKIHEVKLEKERIYIKLRE
jgi:3-phenylpropionate/trans-cinnamate dioxygenase ferredoxin subunit